MKTETKLVYIRFNQHSENGVCYYLHDEAMRKYMDAESDTKFLCEVVVPAVSKADIAELGLSEFDKEIAKHAIAIEALQVKKQQFLAIEHDGDKS
tara:strand:+ start:4576 stop:4860 length:285 start_codon:yes stop_codon:yes gene_type:complete